MRWLPAICLTLYLLLAFPLAQLALARMWARYRFAQLPRLALTANLLVGALLLTLGLAGRFAGHFDAGFYLLPLWPLGFALAWLKASKDSFTKPTRQTLFILLQLSLLMIPLGVIAHNYQMHDEFPLFGHMSMVEQLRYGEYPVYFPPFPEYPARYHYGFDVLAGALARAFGLSTDAAIDTTSVTLFFLIGLTSAALAIDNRAKKWAPLAAFSPFFFAGLAYLLIAFKAGHHPRCLVQYHHPSCGVELYPVTLSNIFQHPVSLGIPLGLAFILLSSRLLQKRTIEKGYIFAAVVILGALSLGQFVYFALSTLAVLAALAFHSLGKGFTERLKKRWALYLIVFLSIVVGLLLGGMLSRHPLVDPKALYIRNIPGFPKNENILGILYHNIVNQGLLLLAFPLLFFRKQLLKLRSIPILAFAAAGGLVPPHFFGYSRSWDIIKFPSASAVFLSVLLVIVLSHYAQTGGLKTKLGTALVALLSSGSGLLLMYYLLLPPPQQVRFYHPSQRTADPLVKKAIEAIRAQNYQKEQLVLAQGNVATELSIFGGLSVVAKDYDLYTMGIKQADLSRMKSQLNRLQRSMDPALLQQMKISWIVYSDEELRNLGPQARNRLEKEEGYQVVAEFPGESPQRRRRVWRPRPTEPAK